MRHTYYKYWKDKWEELTAYYNFPLEIRTLIYTTNVIACRDSTISKYTKTKTMFPDDQAAFEAMYMVINNIYQI